MWARGSYTSKVHVNVSSTGQGRCLSTFVSPPLHSTPRWVNICWGNERRVSRSLRVKNTNSGLRQTWVRLPNLPLEHLWRLRILLRILCTLSYFMLLPPAKALRYSLSFHTWWKLCNLPVVKVSHPKSKTLTPMTNCIYCWLRVLGQMIYYSICRRLWFWRLSDSVWKVLSTVPDGANGSLKGSYYY